MALFIGALTVWLAVKVIPVFLLVFLAVLFAVFLSSVTDQLSARFGIRRGLGLTLTTVGTTAALVGLGALFVPPVVAQTRALTTSLPQTLAAIQAALVRLGEAYPVVGDSPLTDPQSGLVAGVISDVSEYLRGAIVPYLRIGGRVLLDGAAVIVMAIYFAHQPAVYRDGLLNLVSPRQRPLAGRIVVDMAATLRAWVTGQLLAMFVFALLTALGLWALGVPYWLAFGLFTGVAALVPFFGTIVSTILPALFVVGAGWLHVFTVLALGIVVHILGSNLIVPWIMARSVAVPPAITIASVLAMGTLLGPIGLIVAVPVVALGLVLVRHVLHGELYGEGRTFRSAGLRASRGRLPPPTLTSAP